MEVVQSVKFRYEPNEQIQRLLKDYLDMVNFCIRQAVEANALSLGKLHDLTYRKLKERYDYNTQFFVTAYRVALSIVRSWRKHEHKGIPVAKRPIIRLSKLVTKLNLDGTLRISIRPREFVTIKLVVGDYQRRFSESGMKTGEILLNGECVIIPFKREVSLVEPKGLMALDLNETNITGMATDGGTLRVDLSDLKRIREVYTEKRKKIQKSLPKESKLFKRLMAKYGSRESRRVNDMLHKASKQIASYCGEKKLGPILENLKNIRHSINQKSKRFNKHSRKVQLVSVCSKKLKRRLNTWPFRRIQFLLDYKFKLSGLIPKYVSPHNTSKWCSRCGGEIGSLKECPRCGMDRDINACINLLRRAKDEGIPGYPDSSAMYPLKLGCSSVSDEVNPVEGSGEVSVPEISGTRNSLRKSINTPPKMSFGGGE
jgi:putative transposase